MESTPGPVRAPRLKGTHLLPSRLQLHVSAPNGLYLRGEQGEPARKALAKEGGPGGEMAAIRKTVVRVSLKTRLKPQKFSPRSGHTAPRGECEGAATGGFPHTDSSAQMRGRGASHAPPCDDSKHLSPSSINAISNWGRGGVAQRVTQESKTSRLCHQLQRFLLLVDLTNQELNKRNHQ